MTPMVRDASPGDVQAMLAIYAPIVRDTAISFETEAPSIEEFAGRLSRIQSKTPWLVAEGGSAVVGYAYASPHRDRAAYRWSVEVSAYVAEGSRGRGVARALYARLFGLLRDLGYVNAYAGITLPNPASVRLHESMGFTPVGVYRKIGFKLGAWHDVGWWQLALGEPASRPAEPRVYSTFVRSSSS